MKIVKEIARYLVGGLFVFSGLIKVNDPVGTQIKLEEYFSVFGGFWEVLIPAALVLSVILVVAEVVIGIATIVGYRMPITSWILLLMILFFTGLTFYSAYTGKVTDCGCFGDAIKLTPWESFGKDVVLLLLIAVIFIYKQTYPPLLGQKWLMELKVWGSALVFSGVALYAIWHLPYIDFRAYMVGNDLPQLMQPQETPIYEYVMTKNGEEFTFAEYPKDTSYVFKEMVVLNEDEVQAKITDLSVWNDAGDQTSKLLTGDKLIFVIHNVADTNAGAMADLKLLAKGAKATTWILTSSGYEAFEEFRHQNQLALSYFYADATVLKTMIRSNPGILLLQNGVIKGKWHYNDVPSAFEVGQLLK